MFVFDVCTVYARWIAVLSVAVWAVLVELWVFVLLFLWLLMSVRMLLVRGDARLLDRLLVFVFVRGEDFIVVVGLL